MSAPTAEDRERSYWMNQKEWLTFDENGHVKLKPGAPQRVVNSFNMK